ncbi:unnamed protein product [Rotaria magnacalcarata]|uniref:MARVEL domain-containing protein n=1 Tax=Rotaria magnacalcarata TaxID=392030 RepID=A0A816VJX6_9BILA|nr:unnamed protein product [Rotaria magnacalcarata]CAF1593462.1 unnamed protein product [Rotaria magnacalcarata]CAF2121725.1 unnamed protein product [Rotaria magnacalcarata]CAF2146327.1 unnamed protein product [Rotaria magnacalcarata]CAF2266488.1 unnamed protein product [Rotaria magnacalcarata]
MTSRNRALRWLQIILTLFYGQVISTAIYEYIIQGICGLILSFRPMYDSVLLIVLGVFMFLFVVYAIPAVWFCHLQMSIISILILIAIFILTSVKAFIEVKYMGQHSIRIEWATIRIAELVLRILGIVASLLFVICLKQGYKPENF